ncbi:UDP-glucuronosyl/UDP-glucosyltransferase [Corchorus olitorius]|uniref:UDP-glucuronosyl/UDP-glucosyltransferase n=1 Tax=Corchorus olitorius TaxID=93759 RepID=A0A1R3HP19_9ROSI|nr:UDP-glucuronosyl/UDP-glucosyltransferase [Corchorus olitorius]
MAESQLISKFLSAFPQVTEKKFTVIPLDPVTANCYDPFKLQWETIRRSAHLLSPLISSISPPISFMITDMTLMSSVNPVTANLCLRNYVLFISSARMFSLFSYFPLIEEFGDEIRIPGLDSPIPTSSFPQTLLDSKSFFANNFSDNSKSIKSFNGVLINSFEGLEKESLEMLMSGKFIKGLPQVFPVGPFLPLEFEGQSSFAPLKWLEDQRKEVIEAAWHGIPVLGWPQHGDQMINAEVIEGGNWGICMKSWGWGLNVLVKGDEIGDKIKELMGNEMLKLEAARISEEARKAVDVGGSRENMFKKLFQSWNKTE